jgi:ABC-type multidrug transport system ATPase subunit
MVLFPESRLYHNPAFPDYFLYRFLVVSYFPLPCNFPEMTSVLEADSIQLQFGLRSILSDVYLKCEEGTITGLLGRNGQGKTCLMNIIYGTLKPGYKSVRINGRPFPKAFKRPGLMACLPQFHFIPPGLKIKRIFTDFQLDFEPFTHHFPGMEILFTQQFGNLSGGQGRLVEVYCILKSKTRFVLMDEPFSHIMPVHLEQVKLLMEEEKAHKGILISDHLFHSVMEVSDKIYMLKDGKTHLINNNSDIVSLGYARI